MDEGLEATLARLSNSSSASSSRDIYKDLVAIRTKHLESSIQTLSNANIVSKLVVLLERPNSKIVDVVLSILSNLMMHEVPRKQIRGGLQALVDILSTLSEENILGRACRVVANVSQDRENAKRLHAKGILTLLVKTLSEFKTAKAKAAAVRAVRILGITETRTVLLSTSAISCVSAQLTSEDEDLLKAVTKCLNKFTSQHCNEMVATQVQGEGQGFQRLVHLAKHANETVSDNSLSILINLSHLDMLRPHLGNAGTVSVFIFKLEQDRQMSSHSAFAKCVSALCLFCRESVNRMKLREAGGLGLFVQLLKNQQLKRNLHEKIIHSLVQFAYDDTSLRELQNRGLVPALVRFIDEYNEENYHKHSCEAYICDQEEEEEEEEEEKTTEILPSAEKVSMENTVLQNEENNDVDNTDRSNVEDNVDNEQNNETWNSDRQFRVNSPSYQAVQDEFQEFSRIRDFNFSSPVRKPLGMSPLYSRSPSQTSESSPPSSSSSSSGADDDDDEFIKQPVTYSPVENFSDEEEGDLEEVREENCSRKVSKGGQNKASLIVLSPCLQQQQSWQPFQFSSRTKTPKAGKSKESYSQVGVVLQILSRLTQSEVPHDNLCHVSVTRALIRYLCWTKKASSRAGRILLRLSKNLHCLMPYIHQRTLSWVRPEVESRITLKDSPCQSCQELDELTKELVQNFSLLAETGYAEGVMCHTLVKGLLSDKQSVAIAVPLVVRPRKLLTNILVTHEGLDVLLDILESVKDDEMFKDSVYSLAILAAHVGVVSPDVKLCEQPRSNRCRYASHPAKKNLTIKLDDQNTIRVNRELLADTSEVFGGMFGGKFAESSQSQVNLPVTGHHALLCLVHYLYGCRWCTTILGMDAKVLLELASLTDKYLLTDFNQSVSHEIVRRCLATDEVVNIYEESLQKEYPVRGTDESLNVCATSYLLVGDVQPTRRAAIFRQLLKSKMSSDFLDDVNTTIRSKLLQQHR